MEFAFEPERKTPVVMKADVVVVGGGPAGVGAAIRAAQKGANTLVVERFGSLGGNHTNGFLCVSTGTKVRLRGLSREIMDEMKLRGHCINLLEKSSSYFDSKIVHLRRVLGVATQELLTFDLDMLGCLLNEMMEEAGVKLMLRSLFVDTIVENGAIKTVIVENASGRQAIATKVVVDATGRGDVAPRSGAPFTSARDVSGFPMPVGLMWKMGGVDIERLFEYEMKEDPGLNKVIEQAKLKGELPQHYRNRKTAEEMKGNYTHTYTGHPRPELSPTLYPGETVMWLPSVHEWGINAAENAEDLTRAEVHLRKQICEEIKFLKKYVPGFEKAHPAGIAPMMGIREGRHPIGEYVLTYDDIRNGRKFDDAAINLTTFESLDVRKPELERVEYQIPYRSFLAKKINNLLLSGDNISADHGGFIFNRGFGKAVSLGEVAGTAAAMSVKSGTPIKDLKWDTPLKD